MPLAFLPFTQKISRQLIPEHFFADASIKKIQKFSFTPFHCTFGTPSKKYFYCFLEFWDPPYKQNENFTYELLGIKIG